MVKMRKFAYTNSLSKLKYNNTVINCTNKINYSSNLLKSKGKGMAIIRIYFILLIFCDV